MVNKDIISIAVHNKSTGVVHVDGVYHDTSIQDQVSKLLGDVGSIVERVQVETGNKVYYIEYAPIVD